MRPLEDLAQKYPLRLFLAPPKKRNSTSNCLSLEHLSLPDAIDFNRYKDDCNKLFSDEIVSIENQSSLSSLSNCPLALLLAFWKAFQCPQLAILEESTVALATAWNFKMSIIEYWCKKHPTNAIYPQKIASFFNFGSKVSMRPLIHALECSRRTFCIILVSLQVKLHVCI